MIRQITLKDFTEWKKIRLEAVKLHPESFGENAAEVARQNKEYLEKSLQNGTIFCYEENNKMIGIVGTFSMPYENMRHRANLFGLYIKENFRNRGIASLLVNHLINFLSQNHKQVHLCVTTTNVPALTFYQKHGFVIYGTEPDALLINNQYHDEYMMIRKLS